MARVVLEKLSKSFKIGNGEDLRAVHDLSLTVEDKELLVLVGPSGSGKTTTLRLIAGLEEISAGTISIDGAVVNDVPPQDRDIAMVFQNLALYPHLTVFENMAFGLKLRKVLTQEIKQRVGEAAELLGLTPCLDCVPAALSGGQRQRVAVGRAIVRRPKVFLFDEPLSNLDAPLRAQMRAELRRLQARLGATIIHVTHDQAEAMSLGGRIAVLKDGLLQQAADPLTIYHQPANHFVAGFFGSPSMNFFQGALEEREGGLRFEASGSAQSPSRLHARLDGQQASRLAAHAGRPVMMGLRPENISVVAAAQAGRVAQAVIALVEPMGSETHLHLNAGEHSFVARLPAAHTASPGQQVWVSFDMSQARFFDAATGRAIA
ncbi:MAG TPA: ABC transporter ATP-binding protein [Verrucomicrobiae bacterium]